MTERHQNAHALALDALRQRGAHKLDAHRFHLAEAVARRAAARQGAARHVLDEKVATLLQALGDAAERGPLIATDEASAECPPSQTKQATFTPLAGLLTHLARRQAGPSPVDGAPITTGRAGALADPAPKERSPVDAQTLDFFRRTWSRLSAEQRLAQSRASLPGNAGPLNSQHLVHRALASMRELSPAYFERFMTHVDALLWLERAQEHAARQVGLPPRTKGARKASKPASIDRAPPLRMNRRP